jgi:gliding motility-associated-like protein
VNAGINTGTVANTYKVEFTTDGGQSVFDDSPPASTVFLEGAPSDRSVQLIWDYDTPWDNYAFEIYRAIEFDGPFELVGTTQDISFRDTGLENGEDYCYYIRSTGTYGIDKITDPLYNNSQIRCFVPVDNVPACPPVIEVSNICDEATDDTPEEVFRNTLTWNDPPCVNEILREYRIYYTPVEGGEFSLVGTVDATGSNIFIHEPESGIAGCYAITNVDLNGNESDFSNIVCVDNCPLYNLPNAFTPNGDGANDLFVPFPYRFVERIEISIFNRWGQVVFETTDPEINWDGTSLNGKELSDGVYHYVCKVYEEASASGNINVRLLKGYIELIRG